MSAEKKASTALARAHAANDNITDIMTFLSEMPMILSLDDWQAKAYKKSFAALQEKIK